MKKFKKLISTVTLFAFCTLSYSPAFASVVAEQPTMYEYAPQEITEIIVKDPETKAWLESEESPYSDIPVTLVDEFPADVEAEFDAMLYEAGDDEVAAVPEDGVAPANVLNPGESFGKVISAWLPLAVYYVLYNSGLLEWIDGIEFAKAEDVKDEVKRNNESEYYATHFKNKVVYVGEEITMTVANLILQHSVALGPDSDDVLSCKNRGNVMCKDYNAAKALTTFYKVTTGGEVSEPEYHKEWKCGYYPHFHVTPIGLDPNVYHSAHVWWFD